MLIEILSSFFLVLSLISLFYALNVKRLECPKKPKKLPKVSVLIYAYKEDWAGNVIKRKIENFLSLNYPKNKYEIIVYDNGSTGKTLKICNEYVRKGLIKHYRSNKGYNRKGMVLDDVIRDVAKGEVIALTDPDGICEKDWLMKHICSLDNKRVGASIGMIFCGNWYKNILTRMRGIEDVWMIDITSLGKVGRIKITEVHHICGANYAFKRKAWKDVCGHGKTLVEDAEIAYRLQKNGWSIAVTDAGVWQEEVEDLHHFLIQRLRWYSTPLSFVFNGREFISSFLSFIPWTIQTMSLFSLVTFIFSNNLLQRVLSLSPFLISILAIAIGLIKMREERLIPFIPIYLTFDALMTFICLTLSRILNIMGKEVSWVRLAKGRYYHNGTRIKIE